MKINVAQPKILVSFVLLVFGLFMPGAGFFSASLAFGVAGGSTSSEGDPVSEAGVVRAPKDDDTGTCGQSCLYKKANENIALQARYVMHKYAAMRKKLAVGEDDAVRTAMGGNAFCGTDSTEVCFKNYQKVQVANLYKTRNAMLENVESTVALLSNRSAAGKEEGSGREGHGPMGLEVAGKEKEKPPAPYVPTLDDLESLYQRYGTREMTADEYAEWEKYAKSKDSMVTDRDFAKLQKVQNDQSDPNSQTSMVRDTKTVDKDAYEKAARRGGDKDRNYFKQAHEILGKSVVEFKTSAKTYQRTKPKRFSSKNPNEDTVLSRDEISRDALLDARRDLIGSANAKINGLVKDDQKKKPQKGGQATASIGTQNPFDTKGSSQDPTRDPANSGNGEKKGPVTPIVDRSTNSRIKGQKEGYEQVDPPKDGDRTELYLKYDPEGFMKDIDTFIFDESK